MGAPARSWALLGCVAWASGTVTPPNKAPKRAKRAPKAPRRAQEASERPPRGLQKALRRREYSPKRPEDPTKQAKKRSQEGCLEEGSKTAEQHAKEVVPIMFPEGGPGT